MEARTERVIGVPAVIPARLRWARPIRRVLHSAVVLVGAACALLIILVAVFAAQLAPEPPDEQNFDLVE